MFQRYINFIRGVSVSPSGRIGVILTTSSFITFLLFQIAMLSGLLTNAYIGLLVYMVLPLLFIAGLILIPFAWFRYKRNTGRTTEEILSERFPKEDIRGQIFGSRLFMTVALLTVVNILFLGLAGLRMLHFMDTPRFCGTACHKVMNPEWTVYQVSPHARVACVDCHVGEGFGALVDSKLNGLWQIISASFNLYERPIPTPVHQLRPARETCEKCHWPEKFYGSRLKNIVHYTFDRNSTPRYTTLNLKVDAERSPEKAGIHWHIGKGVKILYTSLNDEREKMITVKYVSEKEDVREFHNRAVKPEENNQEFRVMDCVDCHNRATHIYENPEDGVDERIRKGLIHGDLPYVKKASLRAITINYPTLEDAMTGIENHIRGFYRRNYPDLAVRRMDKIEAVISALQEMYRINIHPRMRVEWNSYPVHIGHKNGGGCFRCHNKEMVDNQGNSISHSCTMCHSILSNDESEPFKYIKTTNEKDPNYPMHRYLQDEFYNYFKETGEEK